MKNFLVAKKALISALTEDIVFMLFVLLLITSSIEVLLPGIISAKIPLAFLFAVFALVLWGYGTFLTNERSSLFKRTLPRSLTMALLVIMALVSLFMNSSFGIVASLIQLLLAVLIVYFLFKK